MTSSGHVTIPEATPARAPQKLLTEELGNLVENVAREETGAARVPADRGDGAWSGESVAERDIFRIVSVTSQLVIVDPMKLNFGFRVSRGVEIRLVSACGLPQHRPEISTTECSSTFR